MVADVAQSAGISALIHVCFLGEVACLGVYLEAAGADVVEAGEEGGVEVVAADYVDCGVAYLE